MALFRKSAPEPSSAIASPAQVPALYEPPPQPSAAPRASDLEKQIRSQIWLHMSPDLARSANLSLPELIDWISGASRLSQPQINAIARHMNLLDTPETGVDVLRKALAARMKTRINFDWLEFPGGGRGEDNLRDFIAGADCLTLPELNILARDFYGKHTEVDPHTAMLKSNAPEPTPLGSGPGPYVRPVNAYPPIVTGQEQMSFYPRDPGAESKPARLQAAGWS
jgi:hypothetical protein